MSPRNQKLHLMQKYFNVRMAHLFCVHLKNGTCRNKADMANTSVSD